MEQLTSNFAFEAGTVKRRAVFRYAVLRAAKRSVVRTGVSLRVVEV